jgi:flotillin
MMFNMLMQVGRSGRGAVPLAAATPSGGGANGVSPEIFLAVLCGLMVLVTLMVMARLYKRCPSNKILVISGKTGREPAKCIHGGAAFVWPTLQEYCFLDLEPFVVPADLAGAVTKDKIRISVDATVTTAISTEPGIMENAATRLLGLKRQQIMNQAQDIIQAQMRTVIATLKIDDIQQDWQAFTAKVGEAVSVDLKKIGMTVINLNVKDITSTVEAGKSRPVMA